ncbi:MAG: hypothetical protein KDE33_09830 [Bacteroidetes bacterium]|nr:hypothetical protein [Bacteroidota bacterium]
MLPEWILKWLGGGFLVVFGYIIISNTLWLIFGAKVLQSLPGVNINGARGTIKIVMMLIMTVIGFLIWLLLLFPRLIKVVKWKSIVNDISKSIEYGGRLFYKIFPNM